MESKPNNPKNVIVVVKNLNSKNLFFGELWKLSPKENLVRQEYPWFSHY